MQTLGLMEYTWRGQTIDAEKGSKCKIGGIKQNPVIVQRKSHYSGEWEGSEITITTVVKRGMDIVALFAPGEGELQVLCDTGQSFIFTDAVINGRPDMTAGEGGKLEIKWTASEPETLFNG